MNEGKEFPLDKIGLLSVNVRWPTVISWPENPLALFLEISHFLDRSWWSKQIPDKWL